MCACEVRVSAVGGEEGRSQRHEADADDAALCPLLLLVCRTRAPSFLSPLFSLSSLSPSNGVDVESCVFPIGEWQITEQRRAESSRNRREESVLATRLKFVRASSKTFPLLLSLLCLPPLPHCRSVLQQTPPQVSAWSRVAPGGLALCDWCWNAPLALTAAAALRTTSAPLTAARTCASRSAALTLLLIASFASV